MKCSSGKGRRGLQTPAIVAAIALAGISVPAQTATTNDYNYDALGRMVNACQAGPGAGFLTSYVLDSAGNRQTVSSANSALTLLPGGELRSADGRFIFAMQTDGNLVVYGPSGALWSSDTYGNTDVFLAFQNDGNLVIYKSDGSGAVWNSGIQSNCARLVVQNDGNVVIYSVRGNPVWSTNTGGH